MVETSMESFAVPLKIPANQKKRKEEEEEEEEWWGREIDTLNLIYISHNVNMSKHFRVLH